MTFKPRSIRSNVGVRPIVEGRPILRNLRYFALYSQVSFVRELGRNSRYSTEITKFL